MLGLSRRRAIVEVTGSLAPHTNIALRMGGEAAGEELPEGYAKVIRPVDESGKRYLIHFTSVAPALQAQLGRLMKMSQGLS